MPVYAPAPAYADRHRHPRALLLIVGGHAALIAAVMTVKMDLPSPFPRTPTEVELIELPKPVPPPDPQPQPRRQPNQRQSTIDRTTAIVLIPLPDPTLTDPAPVPDAGPLIGNGIEPAPQPQPLSDPIRVGPRFATPPSKLKPPYPPDRLMREEEAALRLRIAIDERGRVVAVEPVGRADPSFLEAARKHLIAHWRYKPASEDGRPVPSSTVITLRFELGG